MRKSEKQNEAVSIRVQEAKGDTHTPTHAPANRKDDREDGGRNNTQSDDEDVCV